MGIAFLFIGGIATYQMAMRKSHPDFKKIETLRLLI